jgi:hypothetical protein
MTATLHSFGRRTSGALASREKLQIVQEIFQISPAQPCPSWHFRVQGISTRIEPRHNSSLQRLTIECGMPATGVGMLVASRVGEMIKSDVRSSDTVHHPAPTVIAVTHGAADTFHAMAVFNSSSSRRGAVEKNAPPIIGM